MVVKQNNTYIKWAAITLIVSGAIYTETSRVTKIETLLELVRHEQILVQKQLRDLCK